MTTINDLNRILTDADCLVDKPTLLDALDRMANAISNRLADKTPLVICVMNGGLIPTASLLERFNFPLELDYVHATRYGKATEGESLKWLSYPQATIQDREVLIIDDIFDQGHTLVAIQDWFIQQGASHVYTATVINKVHDRKVDFTPDFVGLDVEDRFLFGFGMDYQGFFRNLLGIYAVKGL